MKKIALLIQMFFVKRLNHQLRASPNTIASYRDTFKLLLRFAKQKTGKHPSELVIDDVNAQLVGEFLSYLKKERKNSHRTCNARLAAIHSFFRFMSYECPSYSAQIQRILSIPQKRFDKRVVTFLNSEEIKSLLAAPNRATWIGRRDHALILFAVQTGLRVSELIGLTVNQIKWGTGAHILCQGKGRKERCTPLTGQAEKVLREWLKEHSGISTDPVFPSLRGVRLSRDAVEKLVKKYAQIAKHSCPSIEEKKITPHVLRHTTAVHLLQAGVDTSLIALYLGHESIETTQIYLKADLSIKEKALAKVMPIATKFKRFKPDDKLLSFLEAL